ncbi:putative membrane protein [Mycobacterium sp. MAC_080597_8934]|nr:putative membrane protein [Mycobacterium sp. MAC_080597_8934]
MTVMTSNPPPACVALSGLCAAAYLVCRHAVGTPVPVILGSRTTAVAAVGFSFAGLVATSFPLQLPWLPLLAPLGALAIYLLAIRPFLS